jgi:hypothetical protein
MAEDYRIRVLRAMSPEQRVAAAFDLSDLTRQVFEQGLKRRFPELGETEFRALLQSRLDLCHNRNY